MAVKYVIGIDLGTTNSVLAYAPLDADEPRIELLPIPQLVADATIESRTALPSFIYLGAAHEVEGHALDLPWNDQQEFATGQMARGRGAEVPDRTIVAAKSWLCHSRVDRRQPILPWNAPDDVPKISPVTASQYYLEHLVSAWQAAFPDAPFAEQLVTLTVPASFDASARELTREAALAADIPESLVLLEEPQAAVYSWLADMGDDWRKALRVGDTLLVCDIGGGTTDLTLIGVVEEEGELSLRRIAVGRHLLVGGDNMDLALAHHVSGLFAEQGTQLDPWQSVALWHSCRAAKEALLAEDGPATHSISVLGRGRKLIGGTVSVEVDRQTVGQLLLDGFCPQCEITDAPARRRASGFQQIGLPFESDTAITRHLAAFLSAHGESVGQNSEAARPTHVLFNGGVVKAEALRGRLLESLAAWSAGDPAPQQLEGANDLDHAVARGAAYYTWAKHHGGVRIRGGTGRAYYIGVETSGLAVPGAPRPLNALCVAPFGMEEGTEVDVPSSGIGLVVGEPAHFRFFSSPIRKQDEPGQTLTRWSEDELSETDSLEATLTTDEPLDQPTIPVEFQAKVTELGVLELWCVSTVDDQRWKLQFSVRDDADG